MTYARALIATLTIIAGTVASEARIGTSVEGRVEVVDGDTIGLSGHEDRIRLYGIDAPEGQQTCDDAGGRRYLCGSISAQQLQLLVGRNGVARCEVVDVDRYGRLVAECSTDRFNLNEAMVRTGWAVHYEQYSDGRYAEAERLAQAEGAGVWSGRFVAPWDWRRGERLESEIAAAVASPEGPPSAECLIKGNVSSSGQIYHMPGDTNYERTRIVEAEGERWFCSEAEAEAAGWRRARR